tara:strand:- start:749 stop:1387 length:639 start_codon:yes stop_codon:yes gene_type:complete
MQIDEVASELKSKGWSRFSSINIDLQELIHRLGFIIMENDVSIDKQSRSLVRSSKPLPPHTDHHLAHYILWHCHKQDSEGGFSIVVDGLKIFQEMDSKQKELLKGINLMEHCVFKDDLQHHPMIQNTENGLRIYYSFWMADDNLSKEQKEAFEAFNNRVRDAQPIKFRLEPGECLVIDNGRILHGRSSLSPDSDRLLKRYWIGDTELEKIEK